MEAGYPQGEQDELDDEVDVPKEQHYFHQPVETQSWMEWFLGVTEAELVEQREFFVQDDHFTNPVTGHEWPIGTFERPTIAELRDNVAKLSSSREPAQECKLTVVDDVDIGVLQGKLKTDDKAMVQIASNFNCMENAVAKLDVQKGHLVSNYCADIHQGGAATFGVPAAALYRAYYPFRADASADDPTADWGQSAKREIQLLDSIGQYCSTQGGKLRLSGKEDEIKAENVDEIVGQVRIGLHTDAEVVFTRGAQAEELKVVHRPFPLVDQVLSSSANWKACSHVPKDKLHNITRVLLRASYDGAYLAAILRGRHKLLLSCIGSGDLVNPTEMIYEELVAAHRRWATHPASQLREVCIVLHGRAAPRIESWTFNMILENRFQGFETITLSPGFKTEAGEWTEEAKARFFGAKNVEAMAKWADGQRSNYKDTSSEKGVALREKYATEGELEAFITETYSKKYEALVGKAAKCPRCFMDIEIDGEPAGRMVLMLRGDVVPKTAENFRQLCTGEPGFGYKGCRFFRVLPAFMAQAGDLDDWDGSGGKSIYAKKNFDDENFKLNHHGEGVLSMANSGPDKNNSQFFICTAKCEHLDGKNVVFGSVADGVDVLKKIDAVGTPSGKTAIISEKREIKVIITDCGELPLKDWP